MRSAGLLPRRPRAKHHDDHHERAKEAMEHDIGVLDLLGLYGFDSQRKTKLVRHQDGQYDVQQLIRDGWFEAYQGHQRKPIFRDCEYLVTFTGDGGTRARFLRVYRVIRERKTKRTDLPAGCPYREWTRDCPYFYELERVPKFDSLEGSLVIEWGPSAISWHQHLKNKPVIELQPRGRVLPPFTDYLDFTLSHAELVDLVNRPFAHRDWQASLSAVSGVYLILATTTGEQYVGSAYGLDGFWGRWSQYAISGHGGNNQLKELVSGTFDYPAAFRYSILQVLPKTTAKTEVIRREQLYKEKMGSRVHGLNSN